ncbi:TniQ family protein [Paracoccus nototheniae]|uniref:TniQ family protein n=1 Tax=Paracoccus nototheniae TaxID=2489002 RepID=A0ABW4DUP7_9RHOB|nr:TniQ family protein [Paracoccus nototheniae]
MFMSLRSLPLTVNLVSGECATSYASRLARRNGVPRLITFCSDLGINYFALVNGDAIEVERLAALGGVDSALLQQGTPQLLEPGWFQLANERIKFTAFSRTTLRCCPACLSEAQNSGDVAQPGLWQLTSIRTCAIHGCLLAALPKPSTVNDTFDFAALIGGYAATAPVEVAAGVETLTQYLRDRVLRGRGSSWVDQLPFHVASQTCEMFGLLLTVGPDAQRKGITTGEWAAAGAAGLTVLQGGPDAFSAKLKDVQSAQPMENGSYRARLRVFFEWLRYRDDDPDFDVIRDIVRKFVFENFPIAEGQIVLGHPCPEQMVHSMATARRIYGISSWQLGRRLETIGLARRSTSGQVYTLDKYIPAQIVQNIVTEINALLNATDAGRQLGIDRISIAMMTKQGLIARYYEGVSSSPLYHPDELCRLMDRLRALAVRATASTDDVDIPTAARRISVPMERVTELILRLRVPLRTRSPEAASFRDFEVSLRHLRDALASEHDGAVKFDVAAEILQVNRRTVRILLKQGLLNSKTVIDPATCQLRRYVCFDSLQQFQVDHITSAELAAQVGHLQGSTCVTRNGGQVMPLPLDYWCTTIFRRHDLEL